MGLYPANSLFVSDYLTTKGQPAEDDYRMVADLGFEIVVGDGGPSAYETAACERIPDAAAGEMAANA